MATIQQHTTQLEFHQAMADFKVMFPTMDDDVIEAVLRSNQGAVDSTIDQLLAMSMDNENEKIRKELDQIENDPPPAMSLPLPELVTQSQPPNTSNASAVGDREQERSGEGDGGAREGENAGTPLHRQRGWAPPLLGPLPDDFLRLTPEPFNKQLEGELEDERIALFLQNEEFMAELRWNKDFLSMLDKDSPPEERLASFPQSRSTDEDAIFKERLRNMGKMSRKKFSQLARVFTGRKKRGSSAKAILTQGPAPSRDNLLLQEDQDSDGT
ncbi:CUE domain-containing protein 1 isoform X2 [Macrosteles quadrilineatus]|uniref:CUE domain-containing protein 1 isoform X2 n=1 Tax=Macrosteles quadrilineatus TaxID=74068 RepID=UPI0023E2A009|nr:CUE domain-containing protein 1 isoform X2 [Macrosteles quadrilineatus]